MTKLRATAMLRHLHVVALHDARLDEHQAFIVLEYVSGLAGCEPSWKRILAFARLSFAARRTCPGARAEVATLEISDDFGCPSNPTTAILFDPPHGNAG